VKTVLFSYATPVGTFWIQPQPADRVLLGIDNNRLRTYGSATQAADAVRDRRTGFEAWDTLENVQPPNTLNRWKRGV
jgi:hypothetical protein